MGRLCQRTPVFGKYRCDPYGLELLECFTRRGWCAQNHRFRPSKQETLSWQRLQTQKLCIHKGSNTSSYRTGEMALYIELQTSICKAQGCNRWRELIRQPMGGRP